jgi:hypothetical protein
MPNSTPSKETTMNRTIDFQQLCTEISETMAEMDGEQLADLANKVLSDKVTYEGDSLFTVEEA